MRPEFIPVGQIVNAHGIRGEVKLNPCLLYTSCKGIMFYTKNPRFLYGKRGFFFAELQLRT